MIAEIRRVELLGWSVPPRSEDGTYLSTDLDEGDLSYPGEGLDVLGFDGGAGYWFDHRAAAAGGLLQRLGVETMWEVGAGTGAMASRLRPYLKDIVTVEPMIRGARAAAGLGLPAVCGTLQQLHLPEKSIACVGAFDVIEHLADVGSFLSEVRRVLEPGGVVIVTVPAFPMLWGDEDDVAGHKRRYTRRSLLVEFKRNGFSAVQTEYLFASLVPPAFAVRSLPYRLGRRRPRDSVLSGLRAQLDVPPVVDRVARMVLAAEKSLSRTVPLPCGLSLLGAFRSA